MKSVTLILISFLSFVACAQKNDKTASTFCRFVPERIDDFAWENDKVAFRAYGPAADGTGVNGGMDCWLKRVDYPIINNWYGQMNEKSYHKDWGEGHDPYHVGSSAGCGGTGLWIDGKRVFLSIFTEWTIDKCTKKKSIFSLTFEKEIDGVIYKEIKTVKIELGKRYYEAKSTFYKDGEIAKDLEVCIGLTTHEGEATSYQSKDKGWIAAWETIEGSDLGTAVLVDPNAILSIVDVVSEVKDESQIFIVVKTDSNGDVDYKAGYGWEKAGEIKTIAAWKTYLDKEAY